MMTQTDRDRLVALKKAQSGKMTQRQAATEMDITERQVRRLLVKLRNGGDKAVLHGLRGRSNRKIGDAEKEQVIALLKQDVYRGFGPTLAAEYLSKKHRIDVSKETVRKWMREAGLWRARSRAPGIFICGGRAGNGSEKWCNGTPARTTGWRGGARGCT